MIPIPGDIVHFVTEQGEHRPAMVIFNHYDSGDALDLQVFFHPADLDENPAYTRRQGFLSRVFACQLEEEMIDAGSGCQQELSVGTWHWSAKEVLASRMQHVHYDPSRKPATEVYTSSSGAAKPESAPGAQTAQSGPRTTGGKNAKR